MKKIITLTVLILLVFSASAQIVINEVIFTPAPAVEIKNIGPTTVDVSTLQLCSFPSYDQLQNLAAVPDNMMLGPGEIMVVSGHNFASADDEMGLYTAAPYSEPGNMLDYVEWGSTGHTRSDVAVSAGIWTTGDFVNVDAGGSSIEYDGEGDASTDWLLNGTNSQGEENSNAGGGCEASAFIVGSQFVCEGSTATFQLILTGIGPWTFTYSLNGVMQDPVTTSLSPFPWMLTEEGTYDLATVVDANCEGDATGSVTVTFIEPPTAELSGDSEFCLSDTEAGLSVTFTGQGPWTFDYAIDGIAQGEATVADNPTIIPVSADASYTLVEVSNNSCDGTVSGTVDVTFTAVVGGSLTQMGSTTPITVCVDDGNSDLLTFDLADAVGTNSDIVVTNEAGEVLALPGANSIDFEGNDAGTCLVWNISSLDGLTGLAVGAIIPDALEGCFDISNSISVIRQTGSDCVNGLDEFDGLHSLNLYPNPVSDQLSISFTLEERCNLYFTIIDLTGKVVMNQSSVASGGSDIVSLDVTALTSGAYIVQMSSPEGDHVQRIFMK